MTGCSGIDAPVQAMETLVPEHVFVHVAAADKSELSRDFILSQFAPEQLSPMLLRTFPTARMSVACVNAHVARPATSMQTSAFTASLASRSLCSAANTSSARCGKSFFDEEAQAFLDLSKFLRESKNTP